VIDPIFGQVIDYGTTRYRPPSHLADLVIARDGTWTSPQGRAYTNHPPQRWKVPGE
jgi:hypothetical protein